MDKKVFNVHYSSGEKDKTNVKCFVADSIAQVLCAIPVEDMRLVVGITVGPDVVVVS